MFRNRKKQEELDDEPAFFENVAEPAAELIPQPKQEEVEKMENKQTISAEDSVLTEDVTVNGNLECDCNLTILGTVNGSVRCGRDLLVKGQIHGDVSAANLELRNGQIEGNVDCENSLTMDRDCSIRGNVTAAECLTDGQNYGNLTIAEDLHVQKNAWIEGDITAKQFSVLQGAHLESKIVMLQHLAEEETESDQETQEVFHTEAEEEEESN